MEIKLVNVILRRIAYVIRLTNLTFITWYGDITE